MPPIRPHEHFSGTSRSCTVYRAENALGVLHGIMPRLLEQPPGVFDRVSPAGLRIASSPAANMPSLHRAQCGRTLCQSDDVLQDVYCCSPLAKRRLPVAGNRASHAN